MTKLLRKIFYGFFKRSIQSPISLTPLDPLNCHPVYFAHSKILQKYTAPILTKKTIHIIGRPNQYFIKKGFNFISEVEGAAGFSPLSMSKNKYDIDSAIAYTDEFIDCGRLKALIYQSETALKLHNKFQSKKMSNISHVITQVPWTHFWSNPIPVNKKFKILLIASNPIAKGLFLLDRLLKNLEKTGLRVSVTVVMSKPHIFKSKNVSCLVTPQLSQAEKAELFYSHHILLNMSPMDTMGTFLDSHQFGIPLLTVKGQHAPDYIINYKTGIFVEQPIFYYSSQLGKNYFDVKKTFTNYLLDQSYEFWEEMIDELIVSIVNMHDNYSYFFHNNRMYIKECHTKEKWLKNYRNLYETF